MPLYTYTTKDGVSVDRFYRMGEAPESVRLAGKRAIRDYTARSRSSADPHQGWDHNKLAVHPAQIPKLKKLLRERGCRETAFDHRTGSCYVEDRKHRREICRARGLVDLDGGYGDWTGR